MSDLKISEAGTVQFPMVKHAVEIGWTPLRPDVAKQKRGGEAGTLLRDELEDRLAAFNPWLSDDAIRSIIETLARRSRAPAPCDAARACACSRHQTSYSSSRLDTSIWFQKSSPGRRSSARSSASATDVST